MMINDKTDVLMFLVAVSALAAFYFLLSAAVLAVYLQGADFSFSLLWWVSNLAATATIMLIEVSEAKATAARRIR